MIAEVLLKIPEKRIVDLLCCAYEGGSHYWSSGDRRPYTIDGDTLRLPVTVFEEDDFQKTPHTLDFAAIQRGFQVMAEKYPWHLAHFLEENEDAETGDVFLQCAVLGEIVYG